LSSERHRRASAIFLEACDLDPPERARFLDQACGADLELRREVEDLLAADADPPALLDAGALGLDLPGPSAAGESEEPAAGAGLPERIGGYCIVRRIGEGGMGAVYEAVQENPTARWRSRSSPRGTPRRGTCGGSSTRPTSSASSSITDRHSRRRAAIVVKSEERGLRQGPGLATSGLRCRR